MKTRIVREFEDGDIIVNTKFKWVAVRWRDGESGSIWSHSNGTDKTIVTTFTDERVSNMLDNGTWAYVANQKEFAK